MQTGSAYYAFKIRPCANGSKMAHDADRNTPQSEPKQWLPDRGKSAAGNQQLLYLFAHGFRRWRSDFFESLLLEFAGLHRRRAAGGAIHPLSPGFEFLATLSAFLRKEGQTVVPGFFDFYIHIANYTLWHGRRKATAK
jgi:hypothetical protein